MIPERPWLAGSARLIGIVALGLGSFSTGHLAAREDAAHQLDRGRALQSNRQYREAVAVYRSVAETFRETDPRSAAIALNNTCVCLVELSEAEPALASCQEALALRRPLDERRGLARTLHNTGRALRHLGRYDEATVLTREALAINQTRADAIGQAYNLNLLGVIATVAGQYGEALSLFHQVRDLAEANREAPWAQPQRQLAILNEGVVLERLGAYDEAMVSYRRLMAEGEDLTLEHQALLQTNLATLYRNLGDPVRAAEAIRRASAMAEAIGDPAGAAYAQLNLGLILHRNLDRPGEAAVAYRDALARSQAIDDADTEIETRLQMGDLEFALGRLEEAEEAFAGARQRAEQSGSLDGLARALGGLGRVAAAHEDEQSALDHIEQAMEIVEGMRAGLGRPELRAELFGGRRGVFAHAVTVLARLDAKAPGSGYADRAFEVVQRAKHRELLDTLGQDREGVAPQTVQALREVLGDAEILEFFVADDTLFRWSISRRRLRLRDLGSMSTIGADVRSLLRTLAVGGVPRAAVIERLSRRLLTDALETSANHLFVAPDGLLHYLPFELLIPPETPGTSLIDRSTVAYLPSGSLLARPQHAEPPSLRLLAFGAPDLAGTASDDLEARRLLRTRFALAPIEAAELERLGDRIGGPSRVYRGTDAKESTFRTSVASGAAVVHLATHTVIDDHMQAGAAVLLAPDSENDGLLYPREIAALELRAQLTVLAACSTALGTEDEGRGLASLTGAFLAAGSQAVVATLWDVDDAEAAVFMEQFYYQLSRGLTPADALRRTKQRMRESAAWKRPSLWAAYILVGDTGPVARPGWPFLGVAWMVAPVLILIAFAATVWRRRSGSKQRSAASV